MVAGMGTAPDSSRREVSRHGHVRRPRHLCRTGSGERRRPRNGERRDSHRTAVERIRDSRFLIHDWNHESRIMNRKPAFSSTYLELFVLALASSAAFSSARDPERIWGMA